MSIDDRLFASSMPPTKFDDIIDTLFRNKQIRSFLDKIKKKDIEYAVRDFDCLESKFSKIEIPLFIITPLKEIQRSLHNFIEEKSIRDYYRNVEEGQSPDEDAQLVEPIKADTKRSKRKQKVTNPAIDSPQGIRDEFSPKRIATNKSLAEQQLLPEDYQIAKGEIDRNKGEAYYYYRRPPSHSAVPVHPVDVHGPPPQVAPYFYYTDKDLEIIRGEKDNRKTITTVSRPTDDAVMDTITKRVSTSPLKSCIKNAEVKIARGGVAISFDPWKEESKNKANHHQSVKPDEFEVEYDHIASDDEIRIADGKFFNSQTKAAGIQPKIDPKVKKLTQRDMELAMKKREILEDKRTTVKNQKRGVFQNLYKQSGSKKKQYKNVQSKIKHSVQMDRSKARVKSAYRCSRKTVRCSKSPHRTNDVTQNKRDFQEKVIADRANSEGMSKSFYEGDRVSRYHKYVENAHQSPRVNHTEIEESLK
eukprot:CAMPEP_0168355076 /NCGR_PEP_ID=MMETSP0213-20121227/24305_1 /TAXON_ID=151035 /ORGANISM="Euplotes harpa, Strain FSP1.4" /LENGTH=473 /DNA_ID=CAMNT_0008367157 /DNA_START=26 /DNA_END=1447 /DNA_ORIENTATION=-